MKITPIEIRQKSFEKHFRGFDCDEVNAFLQTMSREWERLMDENKELKIKLEGTEREVLKLREVEGSLYKTLKTAEDTGANVIEQAKFTADLHLKESQLKAEALINEAKSKAKNTLEEAESRARQELAEMEDRLKNMVDEYKRLEATKEDAVSEIKRLAGEMLEKVERAKGKSRDFDADRFLNKIRKDTARIVYPNYEGNFPETPEIPNEEVESWFQEKKENRLENGKKVKRSFFDEL